MWLWLSTASAAVPVEIEAGTLFPLDFGIGTRVEFPGRVRAGVRVGYLPPANVEAINGFATAVGWYGEPTAEIIQSAIGRSVLLSLDAGWRPFDTDRWTRVISFQGGYTLATLGGDLTGQDVIAAAFDIDFPDNAPQGAEFDLGATVHLLRVEALFQPELTKRFHLDVGIGGAFTVGANARADEVSAEDSGRDVTANAIEVVLEETLRRYVHTPTFRVGLGWRFGGT